MEQLNFGRKSPTKKISPKPLRYKKKPDGYIIWTEDREMGLLDICSNNGIHKKRPDGKEWNPKDMKMKWGKVQHEFYMQDENKEYQQPDTHRKLKDKYYSIIKGVCNKNGWAEKGGTPQNLSKQDGDLGRIDAKVKCILMESEVDEESDGGNKVAENKKELSEQLEKNEDDVWDQRHKGPIKVKMSDGTTADRGDPKRLKRETIEKKLFNSFLSDKPVDEGNYDYYHCISSFLCCF